MILAISLARGPHGLVTGFIGVNHFPIKLLPVFQEGAPTLTVYGAAADIYKYSRSADATGASFSDYLFLGPYAFYVSGEMGYPMADPRDTDQHRAAYFDIAAIAAEPERAAGVLRIAPDSDLYRFINVTTLTPLWLRLDEGPRDLDIYPGTSATTPVDVVFSAVSSTRTGVANWTSTGADQGDWLLGDFNGTLSEPLTRRHIVSHNATSGETLVARGTVPPRRAVPGTAVVGAEILAVFVLWVILSIDRHFSSPQLIVVAIVAMQIVLSGSTDATEILANIVGIPWWAISAIWYTGSAAASISAIYRVRRPQEYSVIDDMMGVARPSIDNRAFFVSTAGVLAWAIMGFAATSPLAMIGAAALGMLMMATGLSAVFWGVDIALDLVLLLLGIGLVYIGIAVPVTTFFVPGDAERWVVAAYGMLVLLVLELLLIPFARKIGVKTRGARE